VGECVFCDIVAGKAPCHRVWEDDEHLAFLSIFPEHARLHGSHPQAALLELRLRVA